MHGISLVNVHVLACDYDGTIADGGRCSPEMAQALARVRESGRKVLLVTGRMLPDLRSVCADIDRMFDAVVAENGALLYFPETREARTLGDAPQSALVEELRRRGVPFDLGSSIIATTEGYADAGLARRHRAHHGAPRERSRRTDAAADASQPAARGHRLRRAGHHLTPWHAHADRGPVRERQVHADGAAGRAADRKRTLRPARGSGG